MDAATASQRCHRRHRRRCRTAIGPNATVTEWCAAALEDAAGAMAEVDGARGGGRAASALEPGRQEGANADALSFNAYRWSSCR